MRSLQPQTRSRSDIEVRVLGQAALSDRQFDTALRLEMFHAFSLPWASDNAAFDPSRRELSYLVAGPRHVRT